MSNTAQGGSGGLGGGYGVGGGIAQEFNQDTTTPSSIANSQFIGDRAIGGAGTAAMIGGGFAQGGGLNIFEGGGPLTLTGVSVINDSAIGGAGGSGGGGGSANGGGVSAFVTTITASGGSFIGNVARGGNASSGMAGSGLGGGFYLGTPSQTLALSGVSFLSNLAQGGNGLSLGFGDGGGLWIGGIVSIADGSLIGNQALGGSTGMGQGGAIFVAMGGSGTVSPTTLLALNRASTSGNDRYQA